MMELKVVSWMPAASMPTRLGWKSTSGHRKRSLPMVITCSTACKTVSKWHAASLSCASACQRILCARSHQTRLRSGAAMQGLDTSATPAHLAVGQLVGLLQGGGGQRGGHLLLKVQRHVGELLLDVAHDFPLRAGREAVPALQQDLRT